MWGPFGVAQFNEWLMRRQRLACRGSLSGFLKVPQLLLLVLATLLVTNAPSVISVLLLQVLQLLLC